MMLFGKSLSPQPNSSGFHNDADSVFTGIEIWCTNGRLLSLGFKVKAPKGINPKISLPCCSEVTFVAEGFSNNFHNGLLGRLVPQKGTNKRGDVKLCSSLSRKLKQVGFKEVEP